MMRTNRNIIFAGIITLIMLLVIPGVSSSEVIFKTLEPITNGLKFPEDVAVSTDGKIYVVDGSKGQILVYDKKGQPEGNISIQKPTSIAVGSNGNIYIGTNNDLSVKILDSSHSIIGSLGSGAGEFKLPRNIAIDKLTGNAYVVDQLDHSIKVYTPNGTFISKINDYPNLPQDVAIVGNEIYVIDHPFITDSWGGTIRGAEVSVFDMVGNPIRHFGSYGTEEGQFIRPAGITSDTEGVLYITDSFHGVVMCFETNGTYLGAIQDPSNPMVTPMGIPLGEDRRLFVASLQTSNVRIFGLKGYTSMDVSPSALSFIAQKGQTNPPEQVLTITNSGTGTLTYEATSSESWIVFNEPSGTVSPNSSVTLTAGVNIIGLGAETYHGKITITDSSGISEVVSVTLEVTAPPEPLVLTVKPEELNFTYIIGDPLPTPKIVTVELTGGTTTCTATHDSAWISIEPSTMSGNSYTQAAVSVDPTNLTPGDYIGNIIIDAPGAVGSPANVKVNLTVKYGGTINVSCNIPEASFKIEGPMNYEGSGETWTVTEIPDGTYTITYNPVIGYKTPSPETKEISGGGEINFEGNYISLAMSANIVVSRGADYRNPQTIGIFDANGTMLYSFTPFSENQNNSYRGRYYLSWYISRQGVNTVVGDIDGDGNADIAAGRGTYYWNPAEVAAYRADGTLIEGSDFVALNTWGGANVAAADFDGDGKAEIVVGAGADSRNPAQVRVFSYDSGKIVDTGINFNAFKVKGGVNVAAGDIDGDGIPELITAAGASYFASPEIKVWKIDTLGAYWSVIDTGIHFVAFSGRYGANVTTGDLNGDGQEEIIVSSGPDPQGGPNRIKAFNGDGTEFGLTITASSKGYGLNVASGDLDNDGVAEIVAGLGPSPNNPATVKIYKADGKLISTFNAFNGTRYGAVVSVGDLGY